MTLRYLSLFSGIGGFDLGFDRAGMLCAGQVENDEKARAVLARHWPDVPRLNDVREVQGHEFGTVDVICGGFPCQDLSVAGKRAGLGGARSGLFFEIIRIIKELREVTNGRYPNFVVLENVPGLLNSHGGRDFAYVLSALAESGALDIAWAILDAKWFGVAQRRRRVFIVADFRGQRAAEVLFEREGGAGDITPGRGQRPDVAATVAAGAGSRRNGGSYPTPGQWVTHALTANANDNDAQGGHWVMAFTERTRADGRNLETLEDMAYALTNPGGGGRTQDRQIAGSFGVRRLTPVECERLQGFPDNWTAGQKDSPRYRQLGNAVAVPVAEWLGRRIVAAEMEVNPQ